MPSDKNQYQTFQKILADLAKGEIKPVYLAKGDDYYLYRQFSIALRQAYQRKFGETAEIIQRWGADLKAAADLSFINSGGGLFSTASLIILNEIQDGGNSAKTVLHEVLGGVTGDTIILVHYAVSEFRRAKWLDNLASVAYTVPLQSPSASELPGFLEQMAKGYGLNLTDSAIRRLIELSSGELAIMDNELQKLELYLEEQGQEVTPDIIDDMAGSVENAQVTQFIEAFSTRDRTLAVRTLVEVSSRGKEGLPFIVSLLYNRLIQLMTLHEPIDVRKSIGQRTLSYYFLKDLNSVSRNYSMQELQEATKELAEIDYQFRLGSSDMLASMTAWTAKVM